MIWVLGTILGAFAVNSLVKGSTEPSTRQVILAAPKEVLPTGKKSTPMPVKTLPAPTPKETKKVVKSPARPTVIKRSKAKVAKPRAPETKTIAPTELDPFEFVKDVVDKHTKLGIERVRRLA